MMKSLNIKTNSAAEITINFDGDNTAVTNIENKETVKTPGLEWSGTLLDGEAVNFAEAEKAVAELGDGWRLPTREELQSIVDASLHDPAIDPDKFPDTESRSYWTSTPCAWNSDARWVVGFYYGHVPVLHRFNDACVRAVRASQ